MENIIIIAIVAAIVIAISIYLYKEKKKGTTCIGCPYTKYRNIANCRGEHCSPLNKICLFIQTEVGYYPPDKT